MKGRRKSDSSPQAHRDRRGPKAFNPLVWDAFTQAKSADEFCHAWLVLVCAQVPSSRGAAILVEGVEANTFVPIAAWPEATADMARLSAVVERSLKEKQRFKILSP